MYTVIWVYFAASGYICSQQFAGYICSHSVGAPSESLIAPSGSLLGPHGAFLHLQRSWYSLRQPVSTIREPLQLLFLIKYGHYLLATYVAGYICGHSVATYVASVICHICSRPQRLHMCQTFSNNNCAS